MQITSTRNPLLQEVRRAAIEGCRTREGLIVAEGPHLLEEALRSEWRVEKVVVTAEARGRHADVLSRVEVELVEVSERAFESAASTNTAQGVLALLRPREWTWPELTPGLTMLVVLEGIQDPGNAGAIVRSAEAFGATGVVLTKGSVRAANGKFVRAAAGSLFRMPFREHVDVPEITAAAAGQEWRLYALAASAGTEITKADLNRKFALCVGSEGAGLSKELLSQATAVRIPVSKVESLNAAVACSIALFEASRQRARR